MAKVLAASDLRGFTILGAEHTAKLNAHAAWIGPNKIVGTLSVILGDKDALLKAMPGVLVGRDSANCKGAFLSGVTPDEANAEASRMFTACRDNAGAPVTAYYLGVPRKNGGIFMFGTVAVGSEAAAHEADASIRAVVFKALASD